MSKMLRNEKMLSEIGDRIRAIRNFMGLSQVEFGKRLGVKQGAVGNWETGKRIPDTVIIIQILDMVPVTSDWILTGSTAGMTQSFIQEFFGKTSLNLGKPAHNGTN